MAGGSGKGIEWMIELDAKTQGATAVIDALGKTRSAADVAAVAIDRALSKLEKLPKSMTGDAGWSKGLGNLKQLVKGAQLTDREFGSVRARTQALSSELERLGEGGAQKVGGLWQEVFKGVAAWDVVKWGASTAWGAIEKVGHGLWDIVKIAGGSERGGRVFENILGKEGSRELRDYLDQFAALSEFTDDALKPMAIELARVGVRGADLRNALGAIADVAATSTDKVGAMNAAVESFSRIARTGRVDNRILGGLALNPHDVEKQLAKDLNLAPKVIKNKLQEGTISWIEAMDSIFTVMEQKSGKQLGALGMNMASGFTARLEKLQDVPEELFKGLKTSQGFQDISETFARLTDMFGPGSETGNRIQAALIKTLDVVGEKIKSIDWERVAGFIATVAESMRDWVEPLSKIADLLGLIVKSFTGLLALPTLGKDIGDWFARKLNPEIGQTGAAAQDLIDQMGLENERAWKEAGADVALAEQRGYKEANDQHSPSRVWMKLGQDTVAGLAHGFDVATPIAQSAAAGVVSPPSVSDMSGAIGPSSTFQAGGITVSVAVNVGGSQASAEDIGREIEARVPAAIMEALEQFNVSQGLQ
jgi:hypothetical protein